MPSGKGGRAYQVLDEEVRPPSANRLRLRQILADIRAGLVAAPLVVAFNAIIAGMIFVPGDELEDSMSNGVVLAFVTTCSTSAVMLLLSPLPIVTGGDAFLAAMYGREMKPALLDQDEPFATLVVSMAMCSLFLGVTFWVLGAAQAGKLVQFLPSPVMQGYLAAMGYVMIDSAAAMTTGCGLLEVGCLQASADTPHLAVAMALGVLLYAAQRLTRGLAVQTLLTPLLLLLLTLGSVLLRAWLGDAVPFIATATMNVSATPESAWRALLPVASLGSASWKAALQAAASTASVCILPVAVGRLLGISAIESRGDVDVDYNRELAVPNAVMYAVQATVGFMPCGTSVVTCLLMRDLGGTTKLAPLVALVLFGAITFTDVGVTIGVVPKVGFAMIICNAGLSALLDNVRRAWTQLSSFEFAMVLLHVALTVTTDLLSAVVLGLLFTAASFIVEYSRHSGVLQRATLQLERSKVLRPAADHAAIDAHGAAVFIVHLHGMLFFGSANSVVEAVRDHARHLATAGLPRLRSLLLDFDRCSAIDSSAVSVLFQCFRRAQLEPGGLVFACASPSVLPMLRRASPRVPFEHFTTLDLALEYCENRALAAARSDGAQADGVHGAHGAPQARLLRPLRGASGPAAVQAEATTRYAATTDADTDADVSAEPSFSVARRRAFRKSVSDLSTMRVLYAPTPASELPQPSRTTARVLYAPDQLAGAMPPARLTDPPSEAWVDALPDFSSSLPRGLAEYRELYLAWRTGKTRGAKGETRGAESDGGEWPRPVRQRSAPTDAHGVRRRRNTTDLAWHMATGYASEGEARRAAPGAAASSIELEKARSRFVTFMQGGRGDGRGTSESDSTVLGELVSHMELVVVPPGYLLYGEGAGEHEDSLLLVDSGFVSVYLGFVSEPDSGAQPQSPPPRLRGSPSFLPSGGAATSEEADRAASQVAAEAAAEAASARLRLAKVGPGFMLNVGNFVGRRGGQLHPAAGSEVAVADTFTQLLRLSRARFELLEESSPALACQLYRLVVQSNQQAVDDYRMAEVTSSAFKVAVKPSASLANLLGAAEGAAAAAQSARGEGGGGRLRGRAASVGFARSARSVRQGKGVPRQTQKLERFQLLLDQGRRSRQEGGVPASRSSDGMPSSRTEPSLLSRAMSPVPTLPASTAAAAEGPRSGKMARTWSSDSIASDLEQNRNPRSLNPRSRAAPGSRLPSIPPSPRQAAPGNMVTGFDRVGGNAFILSGVDSDESTDSDDSGNSFYYDWHS